MEKYKVTNGRLCFGEKTFELGNTVMLTESEVIKFTNQEIIPHTLEKCVEEVKKVKVVAPSTDKKVEEVKTTSNK